MEDKKYLDFEEREQSRRRVYEFPSFSINESKVLLPDGREIVRPWIEHSGSVAILAINSEHKIAIERQFRFAVRSITYEIPAGHRNADEDYAIAARRELLEETGYTAESLRFLGYMTPAGSTSTEKSAIYVASDLKKVDAQHLDEDEFLSVSWMTVEEVKGLIKGGRLWDPKTICAMYYAHINGIID